MSEDKKLERLYDYTKFHIGIYLGFSSGLVALIGKGQDITFIKDLISIPLLLVISLVLMAFAGAAGAVVATSAIESESFDRFIEEEHGFGRWKKWTGRTWITWEHRFFWASLFCLAFSILLNTKIWAWVFQCENSESIFKFICSFL